MPPRPLSVSPPSDILPTEVENVAPSEQEEPRREARRIRYRPEITLGFSLKEARESVLTLSHPLRFPSEKNNNL